MRARAQCLWPMLTLLPLACGEVSYWIEDGQAEARRGLEDPVSSGGGARYPTLALDAAGRPVVAWVDAASGQDQIYASRFDGTWWQALGAGAASGGGVSDTTTASSDPQLVIDSEGRPVVAWVETPAPRARQIYARRLEAGVWREVGEGSARGGGISQGSQDASEPALVAGASGLLVVAWTGSADGGSEIYARRFDGERWRPLGPESVSGGASEPFTHLACHPTLALTPAGEPAVAWTERDAHPLAIVSLRSSLFQDGGWQPTTGNLAPRTAIYFPLTDLSMAFGPSGQRVLAYLYGVEAILLERLDSSLASALWTTRVGVSPGPGAPTSPSMALDSAEDPALVWADTAGPDRSAIYLRVFEDGAWREARGASAGGGVSSGAYLDREPALAVAGDEACVAWSRTHAGGQSEIRVRCLPL